MGRMRGVVPAGGSGKNAVHAQAMKIRDACARIGEPPPGQDFFGEDPKSVEGSNALASGAARDRRGTRGGEGDDELRPIPDLAPLPNWKDAAAALRPVLAMAADGERELRLADVLHPRIRRIASAMGELEALEAIGVDDLTEGLLPPSSWLCREGERFVAGLSPRERVVLRGRFLERPQRTLAAIGGDLGVTRERVRQIQVRIQRGYEGLRRRLEEPLRPLALLTRRRLGPVCTADSVEQAVAELSRYGKTDGVALAARLFRTELGYRETGGIRFSDSAARVVERLRAAARATADDAGIVPEQALIESLPETRWEKSWPLLVRLLGLHRFFGSLALRNTKKAMVKAALISVGRLATRSEIGEVCGMSPRRAGAQLSLLPSVVRADKLQWGLREWIPDPYEGIANEITKQIHRDGGVTTTERVYGALGKFGARPASVTAFLATPKFDVQNGEVRLADPSRLPLRDLEDAVPGFDDAGNPYWVFVVEDRFLEGHSVARVPAELAKFAGCEPDGNCRLRLDEPTGCPDISVRWPLGSLNGCSIGYLMEPLRRVGLVRGERARITITRKRTARLARESQAPS